MISLLLVQPERDRLEFPFVGPLEKYFVFSSGPTKGNSRRSRSGCTSSKEIITQSMLVTASPLAHLSRFIPGRESPPFLNRLSSIPNYDLFPRVKPLRNFGPVERPERVLGDIFSAPSSCTKPPFKVVGIIF